MTSGGLSETQKEHLKRLHAALGMQIRHGTEITPEELARQVLEALAAIGEFCNECSGGEDPYYRGYGPVRPRPCPVCAYPKWEAR